MIHSQYMGAAELWIRGLNSSEIAEKLGIKEAEIHNNMDLIRRCAFNLRSIVVPARTMIRPKQTPVPHGKRAFKRGSA